MKQRVSLVTLGVADARARARSTRRSAGRALEPEDDVVFFQAGGMIVALWGREQLAEDCGRRRRRGVRRHRAGPQRRLARGGRRAAGRGEGGGRDDIRPARPTFWGGYSGIFLDPDGHPWEVAHNPLWTLGGDGSVRL